MADAPDKLRCDFCRKDQDKVALLVAGITSFICNECIAVCVTVLSDNFRHAHLVKFDGAA